MKSTQVISVVALLLLASCGERSNDKIQEATLIDRELFFGNPEKIPVRFSPDGKYVSYRAPVEGVMNVWVGPADQPEAMRAVTKDTLRGIQSYQWTYKSGHLLYAIDKGGDENWHVHLVDVETALDTDLTPQEEIIGPDNVPMTLPDGRMVRPRANIMSVSKEKPNQILIQANMKNPSNMDVYNIDLTTKKMSLVAKDDSFLQIVPDNEYNLRLATKTNPEGGIIVFKRAGTNWTEFFRVPQEDMLTFGFFGFNKTNDKAYMIDSRGRDKAALYAMDVKTGDKIVIAENDKVDIGGVTINPITQEVDAYAINYLTTQWIPLKEEVKKDFDYLSQFKEGEYNIYQRTEDDKNWIVAYDMPDQSLKYYNYDREAGEAKLLLVSKPELDEVQLSKTYPIEITSRDNLTLVSYMTIPSNIDKDGMPSAPAPMVLLVHGGPWGRDQYGFSGIHQWLANRGYVVLSVNFRGSTGFGKNFINIAAHEWAGKMHDDLIDAVNWAVDQKVAVKNRIAIMGGSYGGYATLVGMSFTPDVFACGVDIVGPSNLNTLLNTIPPYWKAFRDVFVMHIGDPDTEEGKALLKERSPLTKVDNITHPLLIGQGANDPRVNKAESDQIVEAMKAKNIPVTYVLYPDEGHGFAKPENNLSFFAVTEIFLAKHLGGRYEPIGDDFEGSSIEIVEQGDLGELQPASPLAN